MRTRWIGLALGLAGITTAGASAAELISGTARIIDGDTIQVGDTRVRLHGIDAPESAQTCMTNRGGSWNCGTDAAGTLHGLAEGRVVTCVPKPDLDKYGRTLAVCSTATIELNAAMVCRGMAWAYRQYSTDYAAHETDAQRRKVGIWQADTTPAWQFRSEAWDKALTDAPLGKPIVGVSRGGDCIYHTPWSRYYRTLNLKSTQNKTFFGDEAEAQQAGCRPAKAGISAGRRLKAIFSQGESTAPAASADKPCG